MKLEEFASAKDLTIDLTGFDKQKILTDSERRINLENFPTTNSRICSQTEYEKSF